MGDGYSIRSPSTAETPIRVMALPILPYHSIVATKHLLVAKVDAAPPRDISDTPKGGSQGWEGGLSS